MSDRERAIVMAYTGIVMLTGEKIYEFYKYIEEKAGRHVYTHELPFIDTKKLSREDFLSLCAK